MHYVDEGAGPPLVMVHGNPAWSFLYRHLIRGLSDTHRCVAMDHIGFGLSDQPPGWSYRAEDHARNLDALLEHLALEDVTLVVQDWGGPIGLSYALRHPERVRRIVLLNTWMWPVDDDPYYALISRVAGGPVGRILIRRLNLFARVGMPLLFGDRSKLPPHVHRQYLRPLGRPEVRQGCWRFTGEILGATSWLRSLWAARHRLAGKPVLVLWGMADLAFRTRELERWLAFLREVTDAEVHRLAGVGHFVQEELGPELVPPVAAFLRRTG